MNVRGTEVTIGQMVLVKIDGIGKPVLAEITAVTGGSENGVRIELHRPGLPLFEVTASDLVNLSGESLFPETAPPLPPLPAEIQRKLDAILAKCKSELEEIWFGDPQPRKKRRERRIQ